MPQIHLTLNQIKEAIAGMNSRERLEIARQFSREALMAQLDEVMARIRKSVAQRGFTKKQIPSLIKKVRQEARLAGKTRRSR